MRSRLLTCLALLAALVVTGAVRAQGVLTFLAPIVLGDDAGGPTVLTPMPGLRVTCFFTNLANNQPLISSPITDEQGQIQVPANHAPTTALVNLKGPAVECYRALSVSPGVWTYATPTISIDYRTMPTTNDITTIAGPLVNISVAECNAYHHTWWALRRLGTAIGATFATPMPVYFDPGSSPEFAVYNHTTPGLSIYANGYDPSAAIAARSGTVLAHECVHAALGNAFQRYLQEGICDYLAGVVTGATRIGVGVPGSATLPRNLDNAARYTTSRDPDPHVAGLVLAGALWHARNSATAAQLDATLLAAVATHPADEVALLRELLVRDDDDNDLTNGTPHADALFRAFTGRHRVPWPVAGYVAPAGLGFGAPAGTPTLGGAIGASMSLQAAGLPAQQPGFFVLSGAAPSVLVPAPGTEIHVDLAGLWGSIFFVSDALGRASASLAIPPGLTGAMTFQAAGLGGTGYLGLAGTNGLHVRP